MDSERGSFTPLRCLSCGCPPRAYLRDLLHAVARGESVDGLALPGVDGVVAEVQPASDQDDAPPSPPTVQLAVFLACAVFMVVVVVLAVRGGGSSRWVPVRVCGSVTVSVIDEGVL